MPPKKSPATKSDKSKKSIAPVDIKTPDYWLKDLENLNINEPGWRCHVTMLAENSPEAASFIDYFNEASSAERRKDVKTITKLNLIDYATYYCVENSKDKTVTPFRYLCSEIYKLIKIDRSLPVPASLMAPLIKYLILLAKEKNIAQTNEILRIKTEAEDGSKELFATSKPDKGKGSGKESKPDKGKGSGKESGKSKPGVKDKKDQKSEKKKLTKLIRRGEEWKGKEWIDDAPLGGPQLYVVISSILDPDLPLALFNLGVPLNAVVEVKAEESVIDHFQRLSECQSLKISETESEWVLSMRDFRRKTSLLLHTRFRSHVQEQDNEELLKNSIKLFWTKFRRIIDSTDHYFTFKDVIMYSYTPEMVVLLEPEGFKKHIYDQISYLLYELHDVTGDFEHYKREIKILKVTDETRLVLTDMAVYNRLLDPVPHEIVTIPYILHSMLAQVEEIRDGVVPTGLFFDESCSTIAQEGGETERTTDVSSDVKSNVSNTSESHSRSHVSIGSKRKSTSKLVDLFDKPDGSESLFKMSESSEDSEQSVESLDYPLVINYNDTLSAISHYYNHIGSYVKEHSDNILKTCWQRVLDLDFQQPNALDLCSVCPDEFRNIITSERNVMNYYMHMVTLNEMVDNIFLWKNRSENSLDKSSSVHQARDIIDIGKFAKEQCDKSTWVDTSFCRPFRRNLSDLRSSADDVKRFSGTSLIDLESLCVDIHLRDGELETSPVVDGEFVIITKDSCNVEESKTTSIVTEHLSLVNVNKTSLEVNGKSEEEIKISFNYSRSFTRKSIVNNLHVTKSDKCIEASPSDFGNQLGCPEVYDYDQEEELKFLFVERNDEMLNQQTCAVRNNSVDNNEANAASKDEFEIKATPDSTGSEKEFPETVDIVITCQLNKDNNGLPKLSNVATNFKKSHEYYTLKPSAVLDEKHFKITENNIGFSEEINELITISKNYSAVIHFSTDPEIVDNNEYKSDLTADDVFNVELKKENQNEEKSSLIRTPITIESLKELFPIKLNSFENLESNIMVQVLQNVISQFNSKDIRYCPVYDQLILLYYNGLDKGKNLFKKCHTTNLLTEIGLRDFVTYTMDDEWPWVAAERAKREAPAEDRDLTSANKQSKYSWTTSTFPNLEFVSNRSLKYKKIMEEKNQRQSDEMNSKSKSKSESRKGDKGSVRKLKDAFISSRKRTVKKGSKVERKTKEKESAFFGYDLGLPVRAQFTEVAKQIYFGDRCKVTFKRLERLYGHEHVTLVLEKYGHALYYHVTGEEKDSQPFHILHSSGIVVSFRNAQKPPTQSVVDNDSDSVSESPVMQSLRTELPSYKFSIDCDYDMNISLPSGLMVEPVNRPEVTYVRQSYSSRGPLTTSITDEKHRCMLENGDVVRFMNDGKVEILCANGVIHALKEIKWFDEQKSRTGNGRSVDLGLEPRDGSTEAFQVTRYDVILTNGQRFSYGNDDLEETTRLLTYSTTDIFNDNTLLNRSDKSKLVYLSDGSLVVDFPDGTRITSVVMIDQEELFCDWDEEEYEQWFVKSDSTTDSDERRSDSQTASMSDGSSIDKGSDLSDEIFVNSFDISEEGYVVVNLNYKIEHQNYATVSFDRDVEDIRFDLPLGVKVRLSSTGQYTVQLGKEAKAHVCEDCILFTKTNEEKLESKINLAKEKRDVFCTITDMPGNRVVVSKNGSFSKITKRKQQKQFRCFVINRDCSGYELVRWEDVEEHVSKVKGDLGLVTNYNCKYTENILTSTPLTDDNQKWLKSFDALPDTRRYKQISTFGGDGWAHPLKTKPVLPESDYSPEVVLVRQINKLSNQVLDYFTPRLSGLETDVEKWNLDSAFMRRFYRDAKIRHDHETDLCLNDLRGGMADRLRRRVSFQQRAKLRKVVGECNRRKLLNKTVEPYFRTSHGQIYLLLESIIDGLPTIG